MTVTGITLSEPTRGVLSVLKPRQGVAFQGLQVTPSPRAVTEDRVNSDGAYDTTTYLSAAAVTLTLALYPALDGSSTTRSLLDEIGVLLSPRYRPALIIADSDWAQQRQLTLRFDTITDPIVLGAGKRRDVQIQWVAPNGLWEAALPLTATIGAFIASTTGVSVDPGGLAISSAGLVMPATSAPSPSTLSNPGSGESQWVALLYGPCTAPRLANDTTGQTIEFSADLSLSAGDYVAVDSRAHTAVLNGDPNASVESLLSFATSDWWLLQPGLNQLRYYPQAASAGAEALMTWRPTWPA